MSTRLRKLLDAMVLLEIFIQIVGFFKNENTNEGQLPINEVQTWHVNALKDYCRKRNLKLSGKKAELVARVFAAAAKTLTFLMNIKIRRIVVLSWPLNLSHIASRVCQKPNFLIFVLIVKCSLRVTIRMIPKDCAILDFSTENAFRRMVLLSARLTLTNENCQNRCKKTIHLLSWKFKNNRF